MFHLRRCFTLALAVASAPFFFTAAHAQQATPDSPDTGFAQDSAQAPQTQQQRATILREAQQRVMARRRLREQQVEQDTYSHHYEVYFGAGYLRFRPGHDLQHNTNVAWNVGFTDWIKPKLGITADARGYYGTAVTNNFDFQIFKPSIWQYTGMVGPQYRFHQDLRWAWSAQVLAGVAHNSFSSGTNGFGAQLVGLYPDSNKLAVSVGMPVEYNVSPTVAMRLMPNYLMTTYGSDIQHNLGFTATVVYRFGRH